MRSVVVMCARSSRSPLRRPITRTGSVHRLRPRAQLSTTDAAPPSLIVSTPGHCRREATPPDSAAMSFRRPKGTSMRKRRLHQRAAALTLCSAVSALTCAEATAAPTSSPPPPSAERVTRTTTTDPADTRGPFDIAAVTHRIAVRGRSDVSVALAVRTYDRFRTAELNRHRRNFVIELGTDGERGASRNITVYARRGRLRADLISNATRERIARLSIRRSGPRSFRIRGPRRLTGARRYFVVSRYEDHATAPCGTVGGEPVTCGDHVPERGWLRMDRPAWPRPSERPA